MKKRNILYFLFFVFLIVLVIDFLYSKIGLTVSYYSIASSEIKESFRMVQLSDLHNSNFGEQNNRLIQKVEDQNPDFILITGDLVNSHDGSDTSIATNLINDLSEIAPVYFSYGNQEKEMEEAYNLDIAMLYSEAGATVFEYSYVDIDINNQKVRLGGIYGYCQTEAFSAETHREYESDFLTDFQNTEHLSILMCHMPVSWVSGYSLYDWDVDVVFAGHSHGGQIRFPFIGGLWAPDQGWFPGKMAGLYSTTEETYNAYWGNAETWNNMMRKYGSLDSQTTTKYEENSDRLYFPSYLVLSRGLGNTEKIPRFNNVPEIVVVDFIPEEE